MTNIFYSLKNEKKEKVIDLSLNHLKFKDDGYDILKVNHEIN